MSLVRVLVSGVDTLHLFSTAPIRTRWVERLESAKDAAALCRRRDPLPTLEIAGHVLTMQRSGARSAPFRLESEHMAVLVNPNSPENLPTVMVELRAIYLWQRGAEAAASQAQKVADELTRWAHHAELQVSRVDLAVDFQGWQPVLEDAPRFISRARGRAEFQEGRRFSGFSFGRNDLLARLYDKTLEIQGSEKSWFYPIWRASKDFREGEFVWRLEFQVRRAGLREFSLPPKGGEGARRSVDSWLDLLDMARGLWRFLSSRWLTLRQPRTKETRQRLAPEWRALIEGGFSAAPWAGTAADLYRQARVAAANRTDAVFAGYLAREIAQFRFLWGKHLPVKETIQILAQRADSLMERRGTSLEARATALHAQWEQERKSMAVGGSASPTADGDTEKETDE